MKVILNGSLVDREQSGCSTLGWLEGAGIFETIKTVDGKPWALTRHMRRALNSSRREKISLPSEDLLRDAISQLLHTEVHASGLLRLSFDKTGNWAAVHLAYAELQSPAKVSVHSVPIVSDRVPVKSYPYNHRLEILEQARTAGFDETLLLNSSGKVCEGAVTNVLFKIAGTWCTPPLSDGVLPGIMRALVIENCDVTVRSISASEIPDVESAFLLSSLRIAQLISVLDGREISLSHEFRDEIQAMALRTSVG